jgi:hypothetical protein
VHVAVVVILRFRVEDVELRDWEHQDDDLGRLAGAVYYPVVETGTHWFVD